MDKSPDLESIRQEIERVDRELLLRLKERMSLVEQVARAKLDRAVPFRDQSREEAVLQRVRSLAVEAGLDAHEIERLYRLIMEMSVARQQGYLHELDDAPLRVAYQGVEGSYTHLAAQRRYAGRRGGAHLSGFATFRRAVDAVREGSADLALLPIENTTAGGINETYDLLAEGGISINAEVISHIQHCLLGLPGAEVEGLTTVISHPQALAQCEAFFSAHPGIQPLAAFDTAGAARTVRERNDPSLGALASESAAALYGLQILMRNLQTQTGNFTRFVEVAREPAPCPPDARCKTSLCLELSHQPGALGDVLNTFAGHQVNLSKLESRPILGTPWRYRFYLDLLGHAASAEVTAALAAVRPLCADLRVLGTYPEAPAAGPEADGAAKSE